MLSYTLTPKGTMSNIRLDFFQISLIWQALDRWERTLHPGARMSKEALELLSIFKEMAIKMDDKRAQEDDGVDEEGLSKYILED